MPHESDLPLPGSGSSGPGLANPLLDWNEQGLPVAREFGDTYFSVENGLAETRHVFLGHNSLPQRWADHTGTFRIIETGFGTGLNFLATWQAFREQAGPDCHLHFTSIEKFPLSRDQLQQALALWPELSELAQRLIESSPFLTPGFHTLRWPEERVTLTLIYADVHDALPQLSGPVHAWYLDGFAPSKNPGMWTDALFRQMRRISHASEQPPTVATFTAAGIVKRGLRGAGFRIRKYPGFGRKRDMLAGEFALSCGPERPASHSALPWLNLPPPLPPGSDVVVVGAGLAGCSTARALAERGIRVTLLDGEGIASGASGNPQGGLYIKLAADDSAQHSGFYRQAYEYALNRVKSLLGPADGQRWDDCGVLQIGWDDKEQQRQQKYLSNNQPPAELIQAVSPAIAAQLSGNDLARQGLLFPAAGWVAPADFCQALADHPLIEFRREHIHRIENAGDGVRLIAAAGEIAADAVVVATAWAARELLSQAYLPTKKIRGQLSYLNTSDLPQHTGVLCAHSYMPPPLNGRLCLGATYNLRSEETRLTEEDHLTNLSHLQDFGPQWQKVADPQRITGGRVGFRCTTPDYLPMTGPVTETTEFVERFGILRRNARHVPALTVPWQPGVFLNIGHGSRGLASAPLCAEILAAMITGDTLPVGQETMEALWPGRFLLRDLIRGKLQT